MLRHAPHDPGASTLVGRLALAGGEPDVAWQIFERLCQQHPRVAAVWLDLALALRNLGRAPQAIDAARRALALDKANLLAWITLGEVHLSLDEREEAGRAFRKALKLAPHDAAAHRGLSLAEEPAPDTDAVARMEALTGSGELAPRQAAELHYALAQVYRRAGRDDDFVRHLLTANARQRTLCRDGRAEYDAIFDQLEASFSAEALRRSARAEPVEPVPIFVLGMPRSGTTLVERLLAGHPDVAAGGELDYVRGPLRRWWEQRFGRRYPEGFDTLPAGELTALAEAYARRLVLVGPRSRYVTDKTPGNFHVLGLLTVLFPQARIIHVSRDPMDTCFSILQQPFDDHSPHTCDMALLAHVYGRYRRLMERWSELVGDDFLTVEYERLVESPAEEGRRLFAHCGLDWDDGYLDFHRHDGAVRTFSAAQVRRPIYRSSVGAWRPFAAHLAPLRQGLDRSLSSSGAAAEEGS